MGSLALIIKPRVLIHDGDQTSAAWVQLHSYCFLAWVQLQTQRVLLQKGTLQTKTGTLHRRQETIRVAYHKLVLSESLVALFHEIGGKPEPLSLKTWWGLPEQRSLVGIESGITPACPGCQLCDKVTYKNRCQVSKRRRNAGLPSIKQT